MSPHISPMRPFWAGFQLTLGVLAALAVVPVILTGVILWEESPAFRQYATIGLLAGAAAILFVIRDALQARFPKR